jgi:hypothetical protein
MWLLKRLKKMEMTLKKEGFITKPFSDKKYSESSLTNTNSISKANLPKSSSNKETSVSKSLS